MATVVSQHVRHLGRHLRRHLGFFKKTVLCKTAANFTEISRKHVLAASNRSIIKNRAYKKITPNFLKNLQFSISNIKSHNYIIHHTVHHTSFFRCSPRGFSASCLQQMQGSVVEGLSQTATSGSQCFFV